MSKTHDYRCDEMFLISVHVQIFNQSTVRDLFAIFNLTSMYNGYFKEITCSDETSF